MINLWHNWLNMPKFDKAWHETDILGEFREYLNEKKFLKRWSELSDIAYTYTRSRWSGHSAVLPIGRLAYAYGLMYMFPKYTSRYLFYKRAGKKAGANKPIYCVRNPYKIHKLYECLDEQSVSVDRQKIKRICEKQLHYWLLLP